VPGQQFHLENVAIAPQIGLTQAEIAFLVAVHVLLLQLAVVVMGATIAQQAKYIAAQLALMQHQH
jgi:hypothetical protein